MRSAEYALQLLAGIVPNGKGLTSARLALKYVRSTRQLMGSATLSASM